MSVSLWHKFYIADIAAPPALLFGLLADMYLADFPHVNGRLFSPSPGQAVPKFTKVARELA